jgi:glycosyltransferase involved in cell wall biosynthesis
MAEAAMGFDLSRLFLSSLRATPGGIDRIELGFAHHILNDWPGEVFGVLPTVWGVRIFDRERMVRGLQHVETVWRETIEVGNDESFIRLMASVAANSSSDRIALPPEHAVRWRDVLRKQLRLLQSTGIAAGLSAKRALPQGSVYFNAGHIGLTLPPMLSWLGERSDVLSVFMIHDLIPLEQPQFVSAREAKAHDRLVVRAARYADVIIVPSLAVRDGVASQLARRATREIRISAIPLPVSAVFLEKASTRVNVDRPYFVILGGFDARKNLSMILDVWATLERQRGSQTPLLIAVGAGVRGMGRFVGGRPGSSTFGEHVMLSEGLSTPALRELIRGAVALLSPSLAEGFGLPIIEALSVGTCVLASDIAAHHEAGGNLAIYLTPTRQDQWLSAVSDVTDNAAGLAALQVQIRHFKPPTWTEYFDKVMALLRR